MDKLGYHGRRLILAVIGSAVLSGGAYGQAIGKVTYQGQTIKLAHRYPDFDSYKDDPENLPAAEIERVAALVRGAVIPQQFNTQVSSEVRLGRIAPIVRHAEHDSASRGPCLPWGVT